VGESVTSQEAMEPGSTDFQTSSTLWKVFVVE
jgi:hypothetical protein